MITLKSLTGLHLRYIVVVTDDYKRVVQPTLSNRNKHGMQYSIEIKPQTIKDGKKIPQKLLKRIFDKIGLLSDNLQGDVKHLTHFTPEYRLRVGDYRVLFEVEHDTIVVYRIKHRKNVYK